jgi:ribosome recycling factor
MSDYLDRAEEKMMSVLENLEGNFATIRTGRANAKVLDRVHIDYYGEMMPIHQLSKITVVEGTQLVIKPYDRSQVKAIAHAIAAANLGFNPQAEADQVRILVPQLTADRRKQLAKEAQKYAEEAKVAIRNVRRDCNDWIKKNKELPEDVSKDLLNEAQKLTDRYIKDIEAAADQKKDEILNV